MATKLAKFLHGLGICYMLSLFDITSVFIPIFFYLDNSIIVPALLIIAQKMVLKKGIEDWRIDANVA